MTKEKVKRDECDECEYTERGLRQFGKDTLKEIRGLVPETEHLHCVLNWNYDWGCTVDTDSPDSVAPDSVGLEGAELPGCCGVAVISGVSGLLPSNGLVALRLIEKLAEREGYTLLIATDVSTDESRKVFMDPRSGWSVATEFINNRTSNPVTVYMKDIRKPPVQKPVKAKASRKRKE